MKKKLAVYVVALLAGGVFMVSADEAVKPKKKNWLQGMAEKTTTNEPVSVAAVRGLQDGEKSPVNGTDPEAIVRLESVSVSEEQLAMFMKEGNLH